MNPLWILLIGMAVVVGGILVLKLHAFLSLIAGAIAVSLLTPAGLVYSNALRGGGIELLRYEPASQTYLLKSKNKLATGSRLFVLRADGKSYAKIAELQVDSPGNAKLAVGSESFEPQASDLLVTPEAESAARGTMNQTIGERVAAGFGSTMLKVGILIALASIIGRSLMHSGAAERIVVSCKNALGESRVAMAFLISGFVLAALILSDMAFYLLIPLAQAMRARSGRDYTLYILSIVAGSVMTHSLVPPASGPVLVATQLNVNLLPMILGGIIVGGIASASGYCYALWANRRWDIPLRETVGVSEMMNRDESQLPPFIASISPILLPVLLIGAAAVFKSLEAEKYVFGRWVSIIKTIGEVNIALAIATAISLLLVWRWQPGRSARKKSSTVVGEGLASGGVMVLIIGAGGAFGYVLQQTDIAFALRQMLPESKLALLPLVFIVTAAIRGAQGSAIVAMITAVGIVAPIAAAGGLGYHPLYLALAIGCGSKPCLWMNDAGFWIIGKMSGMTEGETLKTVSVMMTIMGVVGLFATMLGAWLLPLAGS